MGDVTEFIIDGAFISRRTKSVVLVRLKTALWAGRAVDGPLNKAAIWAM